jgi:uncharacterized membrane protein
VGESIAQWFQSIGLGAGLTTFLVAMLPIVELRGAIPVGVFTFGMGHWEAFFIAFLGNMLPIPFILIFIRKIFEWMKAKSKWLSNIATKMEQKGKEKGEKFEQRKLIGQLLGLCIFVAIPLPGTGAWTGALIAAILEMRIKHALPAIALGVLIAGFLVVGITYGFGFLF